MKIRNDWRIWLLFALAIISTLFVTHVIKKDFDKIAKTEFLFECKEITSKIELRLDAHARLLQSGVAFWNASDFVNGKDWKEFIKKSKVDENLPGILGTGFAKIIKKENLEEHCIQYQNSGYHSYKVWPEFTRDVYTSIVMLEPLNDRNLRAIGYDMMTESVRRNAMERARDYDIAALSGKVLLVQEIGNEVQAGNLMYVPVYKKGLPVSNVEQRRAAIIGWVYSAYRMNDLVGGILKGWDFNKGQRELQLNIYDGNSILNDNILFKSHKDSLQKIEKTVRFSSHVNVDFNGHTWVLEYKQIKGNLYKDYEGVLYVFIGGIIISFLLLLLVKSLVETNYKAQEIAHSLTFQLKENEIQLNESQKIASLGRYSLDIVAGKWKSSEVLDRILGIESNKIHTVDAWLNLIHPDDRTTLETYFNKTISENGFFDKVYRIVRNTDKKERWVHGLGKIIFDDKNKPVSMIGTMQDITEQKLVEFEIQDISNRLQLATRAGSIGIWDIDLITGKVIWDGTMFQLFGLGGDKTIDPTNVWRNSVHPEDRERVDREIQAAINKENDYRTEFRVVWPDKSVHFLKGYGYVRCDVNGNPNRMLGINMDITEQKRAHELIQKQQEELEIKVAERTKELTISEKKLKQSVKDIQDYKFALDESSIVAITDNRGVITYVNDKFCEIAKFNRTDLIGNSHKIINSGYHPKEFFINLWRTIAQGKVWRGEIKNRAQDGTIYWVDSTIVPLINDEGKVEQYIAIRTDITSKKNAEETIIKAKEMADSANRAKSEFLANMSHEIRTPMNAVIGFSELLAKSVVDKKQRSQIESIRSSGKTLLKIINDILDLSKIEAGKIEIVPVATNIKGLMVEIESMFVLQAKEKKIDFEIEYESIIPQVLLLDEVRIRQILFNLIGNALKFTQNGYVTVTLDAKRITQFNDKINLVIHIEDSGIGIPSDQQKLIFEPFTQQKGQSIKYGGTGLGLSITKKLVEKMGGNLTLESTLGKGSSFSLEIPEVMVIEDKSKEKEKNNDHFKVVFSGAKILLVDDNSENRKLIIDLFENSQIQIFEATDGKMAVEMAKEYIPDIILMDLRMPVMDGYEATELIRKEQTTRNIPVLAISASTRKVIHDGRTKNIFNEYLLKPIDSKDVFEKMKKYLPFEEVEIVDAENQTEKINLLKEEELKDLPNIINVLETEFMPFYLEVFESQMIDDIERFGNELKIFSEKNNFKYLLDYANKIYNCVDNFEIEKLHQLLEYFPQIIEQLRQNQ
ncbi:CHASE domain-containing protein [Marinifilum sp. RC60d5]|uniref:CHASE domain-containing protein n=1 Tax=Marinifilum sp. RC60d5 TaxID=3458414 RepID=UPI00403608E9